MKKVKLRFPEFTEEWQEKSFGEFLTEVKDKTKIENETTLLSSAIEGMFLNSELFGHQRGSSNIGYKKIEKGMLVLSTQNLHLGNANVNLRFENGMVSPAYNTYKIHDCDIEFMYHWIKRPATNRFFYNATTVGASMCRRNVDWKMLMSSKISVPCLDEQKKIANLFNKINARISSQESIVKNLVLQKKQLMKMLFEKEIQFYSEDGTAYPDWEETSLSEISDFITKGATPTTYGYEWQSEGIPFFKNDCIKDNRFVYGDYQYISEEANDALERSKIQAGDFLIAITGDIGKIAIVPDNIKLGNINQHIAKIRITAQNLNPKYIYYCLCRPSLQKEYEKIKTGIAFAQLSLKQVREITIPLPCIEEQNKISHLFELLDKKIDLEMKILSDYKHLKKALQQKMFF